MRPRKRSCVGPSENYRRCNPHPASTSKKSPRPALRALDGNDARDLLELPHHALELREVRAQERERVHRAAVVASAAVRLADVDALFVERLPDGGQDAWPVR